MASDRDDELLDQVPSAPPLGGLAGYRHGTKLRWILFTVVVLVIVAALSFGRWWAQEKDREYRESQRRYRVSDDDAKHPRPSELVWTSGQARLGLSREPPGVQTIRLPDRILRLAPGHDHAQVKVKVAGGKTRSLEVLFGDIIEQPLSEAKESGPDPSAKAP